MRKQIIGLTGWAGTGKDTVADLLAAHFNFRKLAFADALRGEVANGFQVDMRMLTDQHAKNVPTPALAMRRAPIPFLAATVASLLHSDRTAGKEYASDRSTWLDAPRSPRQILQWWGTEYRRAEHPAYWSRVMLQRLLDHMRDGEMRFVIPDVRFQNEVDTLTVAGARLWQITRPGVDQTTTPEGSHTSATDGSAFHVDAVICNRHDIAHLQLVVFGEFLAVETGIRGAKVTVPQ